MLLGYIDDNGTTPNHMQFHPYGVHSTYGFPVPSNSTSGIPDPARAYLGDGQGTVWSQTPNLAGYGVGSNMNWASVQHNPIVDLPALVGSTATSSNVFSTPVSQATGSTTIAVAHQPSELKFTSLKRFNRNRKAAFKCPHPDPTIPTTDAGQCQVVKGFISSMKNTTGVIDKEDTSRFLKRWKAKRRGTYYSDEDFETAAWTLYGKLEKLHSNDKGWTHDIKDANLMQEIRETKDWSFAKRVQEINNLLRARIYPGLHIPRN